MRLLTSWPFLDKCSIEMNPALQLAQCIPVITIANGIFQEYSV
jgi:hypothetical protein